MPAECIPKPMRLARLKGRDPVADFRGGALTSDAGALLLGAVDRSLGLVTRFAGCFSDARASGRTVHAMAMSSPARTADYVADTSPRPEHRSPANNRKPAPTCPAPQAQRLPLSSPNEKPTQATKTARKPTNRPTPVHS